MKERLKKFYQENTEAVMILAVGIPTALFTATLANHLYKRDLANAMGRYAAATDLVDAGHYTGPKGSSVIIVRRADGLSKTFFQNLPLAAEA